MTKPNQPQANPNRPIRWYDEHADELARHVTDTWARFADQNRADALSPTFWAVFEKASFYRRLKLWNDRRRKRFGPLSSEEEAEENAARSRFAEEYKRADDADGAV